MKVSREQAAANRERILDAAARLFREKGFDGIGVADLMQDAGLTHGGFYGQFASKEDLAAQACARTLERSASRWDRVIGDKTGNPLQAIAESYLSPRHRDDAGRGCALAALAAEAARRGPAVKRAFTRGVRALTDRLTQIVPGRGTAIRRKQALATLAQLVGALILARAVDDKEFSGEILDAVRAAVLQRGA